LDSEHVYSPTQAALGAVIGGPLASVMFIKNNFRVLGNAEGERKTLMYGALVLMVLLGAAPFLPEKFPNMAIPLATVIATRFIVEKHQFTKQSIIESGYLTFHSNWRVAGIGLACFGIFFAVIVSLMWSLDRLGITAPT